MTKNEQWYFIPDNAIVGTFSANRFSALSCLPRDSYVSDVGFVTCRFKCDQWVSPGIFERLTGGYKPSNQRDRAAQLEKTITGRVLEIKNEPVSGFKIVAWRVNPYCITSYGNDGDVVLLDPRGFYVSIHMSLFFKIMLDTGLNVSNNELIGKYAYGWNASKTMTLIPESHPDFLKWKNESDMRKANEGVRAYSISKREFKPGTVYRAVKVLDGDWMYIGTLDTYSQNCHIAAFDKGGQYDINGFILKESNELRQAWRIKWPTTRGKMIFYSMSHRKQQYAIRSDVTGIFSDVVKPEENGVYLDKDKSPYKMYNSDLYVTFKNVMDDVGSSPAFNKINFTIDLKYDEIPEDTLKRCFETKSNALSFPFMPTYNTDSIFRSSDGKYHKITRYYTADANDISYKAYFDICTDGYRKYQWMVDKYKTEIVRHYMFKRAFNPTYPIYKFENGKLVRPEHAMIFVPKDVREKACKIY